MNGNHQSFRSICTGMHGWDIHALMMVAPLFSFQYQKQERKRNIYKTTEEDRASSPVLHHFSLNTDMSKDHPTVFSNDPGQPGPK